MKDKLKRIREIKRNEEFLKKLLKASRIINESSRSSYGSYLIASSEFVNSLNEQILVTTQSKYE